MYMVDIWYIYIYMYFIRVPSHLVTMTNRILQFFCSGIPIVFFSLSTLTCQGSMHRWNTVPVESKDFICQKPIEKWTNHCILTNKTSEKWWPLFWERFQTAILNFGDGIWPPSLVAWSCGANPLNGEKKCGHEWFWKILRSSQKSHGIKQHLKKEHHLLIGLLLGGGDSPSRP